MGAQLNSFHLARTAGDDDGKMQTDGVLTLTQTLPWQSVTRRQD
jgi:hypothetical protein